MSEPKKQVPSPKERPDLYDDYDGRRDGQRPGEEEYWNNIMPDHVKKALADRKGSDKAQHQDS